MFTKTRACCPGDPANQSMEPIPRQVCKLRITSVVNSSLRLNKSLTLTNLLSWSLDVRQRSFILQELHMLVYERRLSCTSRILSKCPDTAY